MSTPESSGIHADVAAVIALLEPVGVACPDLTAEPDNAAYGAATSDAAGLRFRVGKLTPRKVGLFVTVWQRASDGSTQPFAAEDSAHSLVIAVREGEQFGMFIFAPSVLRANGITATDGIGGKRGFRVYPPWSATKNAQSQRSQAWQTEHFVSLDSPTEIRHERARQLLATLDCGVKSSISD